MNLYAKPKKIWEEQGLLLEDVKIILGADEVRAEPEKEDSDLP